MKRIILLAFIAFISIDAQANSYFYDVKVNRVIDGDTIVVTLPGIPDVFGKRVSVRLEGIDTPELNGKCNNEKVLAQKAKDRTDGIIMKSRVVSLSNVKRGKYFRLVAKVMADGENISATLLNEGLARLYAGKKRKGWCDYRKIR